MRGFSWREFTPSTDAIKDSFGLIGLNNKPEGTFGVCPDTAACAFRSRFGDGRKPLRYLKSPLLSESGLSVVRLLECFSKLRQAGSRMIPIEFAICNEI